MTNLHLFYISELPSWISIWTSFTHMML